MRRRRIGTLIAVFLFGVIGLGLILRSTAAHALLVEQSPRKDSVVSGAEIPIKLRFNARIDAARSTLTLLRKGLAPRRLEIDKQTSADTLNSRADALKSGEYRILWQVLAPDGHITHGEIPFSVR